MNQKPVIHGRDHRPGGADPIPNIGAPAEVAYVAFFGSPATIAAGGQQTLTFQEFDTTNSDVFATVSGATSTPHNTTGDNGVIVKLGNTGLVLAIASFVWANGAVSVVSFADIVGSTPLTQNNNTATEALASNAFAGVAGYLSPFSVQASYVNPSAYPLVSMKVQNKDSGSHTINSAEMTVFFWPNSNDLASVY